MNFHQNCLRTLFLSAGAIIGLLVTSQTAAAASFNNPLIKNENAGCLLENLESAHFSEDFNAEERLNICRAFERIALRLNSTAWSPALSLELSLIWKVFSDQEIVLRRMPQATSPGILAMADPGQAFSNQKKFASVIYLRPQKAESKSFLPIMIHELRHVYDFYNAWSQSNKLSSLEVERRGFLVMGKVARDSGLKISGFPEFWKNKWRNLSETEIAKLSQKEVDKYLLSTTNYRHLFSETAPVYDFTEPKNFAFVKADVSGYGRLIPITAYDLQGTAKGKNSDPNLDLQENLPDEAIFGLVKPTETTDEKTLLRIALENEKKLAIHLDELIYDQKAQLQCLENGKITGTILSGGNDLRAGLRPPAAQSKNALLAQSGKPSSCTDETELFSSDRQVSFGVLPELDRMVITFGGYVQFDNRKLAEYSVTAPQSSDLAQSANDKAQRFFQGKIYISPEDGQIVRFYGVRSLFNDSEASLTPLSPNPLESLPMIAIRQKFDLDHGVWLTSYIGSIALDEKVIGSMSYRFSVNFQNFRRIADRENRDKNQFVPTDHTPEPEFCGDAR